MRYLTVEEVISINVAMIKRYSPEEQIGILHPDLLESAIYRPQQSLFGEDAYPTIFDKAAALLESLSKNHCFCNANKRTAFTSMVVFLLYNGETFRMDEKQAEDFTVDVVVGIYEFHEIASVIQAHC